MAEEEKTREQLLQELAVLRQRMAELTAVDVECKEAKAAAARHREALQGQPHALNERVKELQCLYAIARLVERESALEDVLQGVVELLPPAWQYAEIVAARLTWEGREFQTANWRATPWQQSAALHVHGRPVGTVDVAYLEEGLPGAEEPFLAEEQDLLQAVAERVGRIVERMQAEEALRDSQHMLQTILDSIPAAVFWKDRDSIYLGGNRTWLEAVGLESSEEVVGKSDYDLSWEKEQADSFREYDRRVMEIGIPESGIIEPYLRADGTRAWAETNKVPLRDTEGRVIGVLGTYEDITERKRAEAALRCSLEETEHSRRLLLALSQAAQAVQRARTSDEVYQTIGDEIGRLGYQATIFTLTDDRASLAASYMTFTPELLRAAEKLTGLSACDYRFRLEPGGFYERLVAGGKPVFSDPGAGPLAEALPRPMRPLAGRLATRLGVEKAIYVPLQIGGETQALLTVMGADLTEASVPAMAVFANQAATALENAQLFQQVRAGQQRSRQLAGQVISAQEEERQHLARELHDELGQALTAMTLNLAEVERNLPSELAPVLREKLAETRSLVDETLNQVRQLALDLRPSILDDLGLGAALRWYTNRYVQRLDVDVQLEVTGLQERLAPAVETTLYRVAQEALTNIARHAQASRVRLHLARQASAVVLLIQDDGRGFDVAEVVAPTASGSGAGLMGMSERAALLGGTLDIQSRPGQGTRLLIEIPLPGREGA